MKSRSRLFIIDNGKWRTFHSKDDTGGKLWPMEVTVVTSLDDE